MNTEAQIKNFLLTLSESFPGSVKTSTLQVYYSQIANELAETDLVNLLQKLTRNCEFFPSIKNILDNAGKTKQSPRELAQEFVETMITIFQSPGNAYEIAGSENYNLWKKYIGCTKFDFQNGNIQPQFHKGAWIDRMEKVFSGDNLLELDSRKSPLLKLGGTNY